MVNAEADVPDPPDGDPDETERHLPVLGVSARNAVLAPIEAIGAPVGRIGVRFGSKLNRRKVSV